MAHARRGGQSLKIFHTPCELLALESRVLLSTSFNPDGPVVHETRDPVSAVVIADFDSDGVMDMVVGAGREIRFLKGRGDGTFAPARLDWRLNAPVGILVTGDFDNDGKMDLLSIQQVGGPGQRGWMRLMRGFGTGSFQMTAQKRLNYQVVGAVVGNLDGDRQDEVLIVTRSPSFTTAFPREDLRLLDPDRPSIFQLPPADRPITGLIDRGVLLSAPGFTLPAIGDVNNDGSKEIAIGYADQVTYNVGHVLVFRIGGSPFLLPPSNFGIETITDITTEGTPTSVAWADLSGRGAKADLVFSTLEVGPVLVPHIGSKLAAAVVGGQPDTDGGFVGRTFRAAAKSTDPLVYDDAVLIHQREFAVAGIASRTANPRYEISFVGNLTDTGRPSIALTISDDEGYLFDAPGTYYTRTTQMVMLTRGFENLYQAAIVRETRTTGSPTATGPAAVAGTLPYFTFADLRLAGRTDIIAVEQPELLGAQRIKVVQNTVAFKRPRFTSFTAARKLGGISGMIDFSAQVRSPDFSRGETISSVKIYRDSNNNGRLDEQDRFVIDAVPVVIGFIGDTDGTTFWSASIDAFNVARNPRYFALATDTNGLIQTAATILG